MQTSQSNGGLNQAELEEMDGGAPATTDKKPVVKRTNVSPWSAAIMGSRASSMAAAAAAAPTPSPSSNPSGTRSQATRIVNDVVLPSMGMTQQSTPGGLAGTAKIQALQGQWEKNQAREPVQRLRSLSSSSVNSTESSGSSASSVGSARPRAGPQSTVPRPSGEPIFLALSCLLSAAMLCLLLEFMETSPTLGISLTTVPNLKLIPPLPCNLTKVQAIEALTRLQLP